MDDLLNEYLEIDGQDDEAIFAAVLAAVDDARDSDDDEPRVLRYVDIEGWRLLENTTFKENFRMDKAVFQRLIVAYGRYLQHQPDVRLEAGAPLDVSLMYGLWILFNPDTFRSTSNQFGAHKSVVYNHYVRVIQSLHALSSNYIKWPTAEQRRRTKEYFQRRFGYPGVIGIIDGTLVTITAPLERPQDYVDRHHSYSINIQATCNDELLLIDVYVGESGRVGDRRTFDRSPLNIQLLTRDDMMGLDEHLLGDGAYGLTDKLMIPYIEHGRLPPRQRVHNNTLSRCRSYVENCNALLKGRHRRLKFLPMRNRNNMISHIVASLVIHNFILLEGEEAQGLEPQPPVQLPEDEYQQLRAAARNAGHIKREQIADLIHHRN